MLYNIEELSKGHMNELPLNLKLGTYRRNLLLSGLDKEDSELKERGKNILYALKRYRSTIDPTQFENIDFAKFVLDPFNKSKL